jgi:hypothetical protein
LVAVSCRFFCHGDRPCQEEVESGFHVGQHGEC